MDKGTFRSRKAQGEQHEVGGNLTHCFRLRHAATVDVLGLGDAQCTHLAGIGREELDRRRKIHAVSPLLMRALHLKQGGLHRPGMSVGALVRRLHADREVRDAQRTLPVRRANAVGTRVTAAQHDDVLALGRDLLSHSVPRLHAVGLRQKLHGVMDAERVASGNGEIARLGCPGRDHDRVVASTKLVPRDVDANLDARAETRSFGLHLREAGIQMTLLHLEIGDAVPQQSADAIVFLEDCDRVPDAGQLLRCSKAGGPRTNDRNRLARQSLRRYRLHPPVIPGLLDNRRLDLLDGHGRLIDGEHAG